jgi:tetrapyrrole methylase family protein/MazG family protein
MAGRVVVVGLGPAGTDLLVPAARTALERAGVAFVRTARHPAVDDLTRAGLTLVGLDDEYDDAADLDAAYGAIVRRVLAAAAEHDSVAYAVPGNPVVAERTVALLHEASRAGTVALEVVPGLSFAELAWSRLGVDPMRGARLVDGSDLAEVDGPTLIAQCDSKLVLSDVKLAMLEHLEPTTPVIVLQRLGLPGEAVHAVPVVELDRVVEPDHLTSLFVDDAGRSPAHELARLLALAERLRRPGGCPWDGEQTHHSLTRYLLEEAYEVVEAVEALPSDAPASTDGRDATAAYAALEDELGDLLYQVVFHAVLAEEADAFTMADVARGIHDKLVRRHPHVFGDVTAGTSSDVMRNWEQIKKEEKGASSIVAGITPGLPSLLYTHKLFRKAASVGLEPGSRADALDRLAGALAALQRADDPGAVEAGLAELLAAAVVLARSAGIDAESVLRGWAARFRDRFVALEALATARDVDLATADSATVQELWSETA